MDIVHAIWINGCPVLVFIKNSFEIKIVSKLFWDFAAMFVSDMMQSNIIRVEQIKMTYLFKKIRKLSMSGRVKQANKQ